MTTVAKSATSKAAKSAAIARPIRKDVVSATVGTEATKKNIRASLHRAKKSIALKRPARDLWIVFLEAYSASPTKKIEEIKRGIPAERIKDLAMHMDLPQTILIDYLGLARSSVNYKANTKKMLAKDESELVLGVESLIGQVETMVEESGDPTGFDPAKWVADWIKSPNPVLGGKTPSSFMDTVEGQKLVANILAMAQTGAYA